MLIVGGELQQSELSCPCCSEKNNFLTFIDKEAESSNSVKFKCPSCKKTLIIKNSHRNMLLGILAMCIFIICAICLSIIQFMVLLGITLLIWSILEKKGLFNNPPVFIIKK